MLVDVLIEKTVLIYDQNYKKLLCLIDRKGRRSTPINVNHNVINDEAEDEAFLHKHI